MDNDWITALLGGLLIGTATSLMLLLSGRIAGISGVVGGLLHPAHGDTSWRLWFVAGLVVGGALLAMLNPEVFHTTVESSPARLALAGLLVGFGTRLGNGCTSGHGVCGMSRLSTRSIIATLTFTVTGALTVLLVSLIS